MRSLIPSPEPTADAADPLAAIISLLRPQAVFSKIVSGAGAWSIRYTHHEDPAFCIVLEGSCFIDVDGVGKMELREGDFLLLPETPGFTMATDLGIKPQLVASEKTRARRHGAPEERATMRMLGGYFRFDHANSELLVKLLPAAVHVRKDEEGAARLMRVVELIAEEADADRPGRALILERLVEVLLLEALRLRLSSGATESRGLLAGLADPSLAAALRVIHVECGRRWTVADLARVARMSRAVFAERFTRTVGVPPMQYLLEWRMAVAKDLLRRERPPLAELADRIGYQSASAFSSAFSRLAGCSPSEFARGA
jgi:AraC-like DNA-binding protein